MADHRSRERQRWPRMARAAGVAALLTAMAVHPAAGADPTEDCRTRGTTVAANADYRLFVASDFSTASRVYYACRVGSRRAHVLGRNEDGEGLQRPTLRLAGNHAIWSESVCDRVGGCESAIWAQRIDRRHRPERLAGTGAAEIVAVARQALAWVRYRDPDTVEVVVVDKRGRQVIDHGTGFERGSLAISGRRVYWVRDGAPLSYRLQ